jgi:hypothetical protein
MSKEATTTAATKPGESVWANSFVQKAIAYADTSGARKQIKDVLLDPLLNHVLNRIFPYIILTCVLFVLLLVVILITLGIFIFHIRSGSGGSAAAALAAINPLPQPL